MGLFDKLRGKKSDNKENAFVLEGESIPVFIDGAGACICSKNILSGKSKLKWCLREESANAQDNGWRFFSMIDDSDYLDDPNNLSAVDFNTVAAIEPAIIGIYSMPVGTDLQLVQNEDRAIHFIDNLTDQEISIEQK